MVNKEILKEKLRYKSLRVLGQKRGKKGTYSNIDICETDYRDETTIVRIQRK